MNISARSLKLAAIISLLLAAQAVFGAEKKQVIAELNYEISGKTGEEALRRYVGLEIGDSFDSEEAFVAAVEDKKQILINYRVFDSVELERRILRQDDSTVEWALTYAVVDAMTLTPIPYPKYSSSSGFRLAIRTDYYNAFGSMTDIELNTGINIQKNEVTDKTELSEWNVTADWSGYRLNDWLKLSFGFEESLNQSKFTSGLPATQYYFSYYKTTFSTKFQFDLPGKWSYFVKPFFDMRYGYEDKASWGNMNREPLAFAATHGGSWGRVNWHENLRDGQSYSLQHTVKFIFDSETGNRKVANEFDAVSTWYWEFGGLLDFYPRVGAFYIVNNQRSAVGSYLRGVDDSSMSGDWGVYCNATLAFQFWRLPGVWDAQIHPFFDIGIAGDSSASTDINQLKYGAGVDLVLYLDALPTLVARGTIGLNLSDDISGWDKLEIAVASYLSY